MVPLEYGARGAPKESNYPMKPDPEAKLSKLRRNARSGGALRG